jgi:hypothetical protein
MELEKRRVGLVLMLFALISFQFLINGCANKVIERANIKQVSLTSEWNQVKKEVGRNIMDPGLVEIQLLTHDDGRVLLYSWQWIESVNGITTLYFAQKNADKYKITASTNTYSLNQKPVSVDTAVNTVDRYGLDKIFKDNTSANLVLRQAKEPKFSVINSKHVFIKDSAEIDESKISSEKIYIVGLYGAPKGSRQYMFSVE